MKAKLFSCLEEKICSFSTFHVEEEKKKKKHYPLIAEETYA